MPEVLYSVVWIETVSIKTFVREIDNGETLIIGSPKPHKRNAYRYIVQKINKITLYFARISFINKISKFIPTIPPPSCNDVRTT